MVMIIVFVFQLKVADVFIVFIRVYILAILLTNIISIATLLTITCIIHPLLIIIVMIFVLDLQNLLQLQWLIVFEMLHFEFLKFRVHVDVLLVKFVLPIQIGGKSYLLSLNYLTRSYFFFFYTTTIIVGIFLIVIVASMLIYIFKINSKFIRFNSI